MRLRIIVLAGLFCSLCAVNGQTLHFNHLGIEQGLSQSSVYSIFQDSKGFMWMGSSDGLNKFDGNSVSVYRHSDADRPLSNYFTSTAAEDIQGNLWFGSRKGLTRYIYKEDRIEHVFPGNDSSILESWIDVLGVDQQHHIWYWDRNNYFFRYHPVTGVLKRIAITDTSPIFRQAIIVPGGSIWFNTSSGLCRYNMAKDQFDSSMIAPPKGSSVSFINAFAIDDKGLLWMTGIRTLLCLDTRMRRFIPVDERLKVFEEGVNVVYAFRNTIWFGSEKQGLIAYHKKEGLVENYRHEQMQSTSIATDIITAIYADHSDNLWVASEGFGMNYTDLKPSKFKRYQQGNSGSADFSSTFIKCFYEDSIDRLWIGTFRGGINIFDRKKNSNKVILFPHSVSSVIRENNGNLLASTESGIVRIDEQTFKTEWVPIKRTSEVYTPLKEINSFCRTRDGVLLVTGIQGLFQAEVQGQITSVVQSAVCRGVALGAVFQSSDGRIWAADFQGGFLYILRIENGQPVLLTRILEGLNIKCFYEDIERHLLWMGSENGLIRYDLKTGKVNFINEKKGLPNNHVYGVLCDRAGRLWLSTNKGICCYNPLKNTFRNYDVKDGLQSNEFNTFAYYQSLSGEMFFGGVNGFNSFYPEAVEDNPYKPKVALCRLLVNDEETGRFGNPACLDKITLEYSENTVSFDFSSMEFSMHDKNRYEYKLLGTDKEWVKSGNKHFARYSNLRPGKYRFLVRACNNDGVWGDEQILCHIDILYPWWQKWWSVAAFVLLVLLLLAWFVKSVINNKLAAQKRLLEKQRALEEERNRISKDMHDDLGSGLSKIAIMSEILKTTLKDKNDMESVGKISRTANELVDSMSQIIWAMNPENDNIENILGYLRKFSLDFFEDSGIRCELDFPDIAQNLKLPQSVRRNLFLVIKETFHNILKHSGALEVKVKVSIDSHHLRVVIKDNGKGFDIGKVKYSGNGLNNMEKRMNTVNGRFYLESHSSSGTTTTLEIGI